MFFTQREVNVVWRDAKALAADRKIVKVTDIQYLGISGGLDKPRWTV